MASILEQAAAMQAADYNPNTVIQAVNELQPRGKDEALSQIEAVLNKHPNDDNTGIFWVLRVLFDVAAGEPFPPVRIGEPTIAPPKDAKLFPRFPIALIEDIPLLVVSGYTLAGMPESAQAHVDIFRAKGALRSAPLAPPADKSGVKDVFSQQWKAAYGTVYAVEVMALIDTQLKRLG